MNYFNVLLFGLIVLQQTLRSFEYGFVQNRTVGWTEKGSKRKKSSEKMWQAFLKTDLRPVPYGERSRGINLYGVLIQIVALIQDLGNPVMKKEAEASQTGPAAIWISIKKCSNLGLMIQSGCIEIR